MEMIDITKCYKNRNILVGLTGKNKRDIFIVPLLSFCYKLLIGKKGEKIHLVHEAST